MPDAFETRLAMVMASRTEAHKLIEASYDDPNFKEGVSSVTARPTQMRNSLEPPEEGEPGSRILIDLIDDHFNSGRETSSRGFLNGMLTSMRLCGRHMVLDAQKRPKIRAALTPNEPESQVELKGFDGWMMPVSSKSKAPLAALAAREGTLALALEATCREDKSLSGSPRWPWAIPLRADRENGRHLTFPVFEAIEHGHGRSIPADVLRWGLANGRNETVAYWAAVHGLAPRTWKEDTAFPWLLSNQGARRPTDEMTYLDTPAHAAARQGILPEDLAEMISSTLSEAWSMRNVCGETLAESLAIGNPVLANQVLPEQTKNLESKETFFSRETGTTVTVRAVIAQGVARSRPLLIPQGASSQRSSEQVILASTN